MEIKTTQSFKDYKGYTIRLSAHIGIGFGYAIIKEVPNVLSPNGIKKIYIRQQNFNFIKADDLLNKACNYIDNFEQNLINSFDKKVKQLK